MQFNYLLDKINSAKVEDYPFSHVQINNFFNDSHLKQIVSAAEIAVPGAESDTQLFNELFAKGYKIIDFPGCIIDRDVYIKWHRNKDSHENYTNTSCEGFGVTLRLISPESEVISGLTEFMKGKEFQESLASKFGIDLDSVSYDSGIQKYLDGYEISPHPDTRNKALTYMVNINPDPLSEKQNHHTHYLEFRQEFKYVQAYWDGHPNEDRCWVPWSWCETKKIQRENNSIVIFSPKNDTIHAVKASYNHLNGQRTQMYGNLWYREKQASIGPEWENYVITVPASDMPLKSKLRSMVPSPIKDLIRRKKPEDSNVIPDRLR